MHEVVAPHHPEHDREDRSTEENDEDHARDGGGLDRRLVHDPPGQLPAECGQKGGPHGAHRGCLGRRRDAPEDRAQHRQDQQQGRQQCGDDLALQPGLFLRRNGGCGAALGIDDRLEDHISDVEKHKKHARQHGPCEEVADRDRAGREVALGHLHLGIDPRKHVPHEDQDGRRRDDLAQRPRGADHARGQRRFVAGAHHGRQRDQTHGHHRGPDHAGRGRQHCAHDHHGNRKAAAHVAEEFAHGHEELLGDLRSFEHHPHEHEEWHRHQHLVGHVTNVAVRQRAEVGGIEDPEVHANGAEDQGRPREGEGHREAQQQKADDAYEHEAGEKFSDEDRVHQTASVGCVGSSLRL